MAILRTNEKDYVKIIYNECKVIGDLMYVKYVVYNSEDDREKEKSREEPLMNFLIKLRAKAYEMEKTITEACDKYGIDRSDPNCDISKMPQDEVDELTALGKQLSRLEEIEYRVQRGCYNYVYKDDFTIEESEIAELEGLGYKREWLEDKLELKEDIESFCGKYDGEKICPEMYYEKLKNYLNMEGEDI